MNKRTEEFLMALLGLTRYDVYCDSSETFQGMNAAPCGDYIDADELNALVEKYRKDTNEPKTFQDLMSLLPGSEMGEDNDGQLIIYTGRSENPDGTLDEFEPS